MNIFKIFSLQPIYYYEAYLLIRFACSSSFAIYSTWIMLKSSRSFILFGGVNPTPKSKFEAIANYVVHCVFGNYNIGQCTFVLFWGIVTMCNEGL